MCRENTFKNKQLFLVLVDALYDACKLNNTNGVRSYSLVSETLHFLLFNCRFRLICEIQMQSYEPS